jgi:transcriptional regulator with XRE-family HTH domain
MTPGKRIKELRKEMHLTQQELADKLGFKDKSSIAHIESDKRDIPHSLVIKFAEVLNTNPSYIMGWTEEKNSSFIPEDKSAVIERIINMPDDRFQEMKDRLQFAGYLDPDSEDV